MCWLIVLNFNLIRAECAELVPRQKKSQNRIQNLVPGNSQAMQSAVLQAHRPSQWIVQHICQNYCLRRSGPPLHLHLDKRRTAWLRGLVATVWMSEGVRTPCREILLRRYLPAKFRVEMGGNMTLFVYVCLLIRA